MGLMGCLRWFLFVLNLLLWLGGMATLAIGLFLLLDSSVRNHVELSTDLSDYYVSVYILIAVGVILSLFGFLGCVGALRKNQCMLISFFVLLLIVFCAELACAIIAYTHQDTIKQYVDKSLRDAVYQKYHRYDAYTKAIDKIQENLQCCGVQGFLDWLNSYYSIEAPVIAPELGIGADDHGRVPRSCCNEAGRISYPANCGEGFSSAPLWTYKQFLHEKGCNTALYERFYENLDVVIGVAVGIGIFQLLGMIVSMALCCWLNRQKETDYRNY